MRLVCVSVCLSDEPDAPGEPEAQEVGNDFVSLTWQKPRSGQSDGFNVISTCATK